MGWFGVGKNACGLAVGVFGGAVMGNGMRRCCMWQEGGFSGKDIFETWFATVLIFVLGGWEGGGFGIGILCLLYIISIRALSKDDWKSHRFNIATSSL